MGLTGVLAGRYEIDREIGRGGMATVYLARDLRHNSNVAVKILHPELAAFIGQARFTREIQVTARLQHPNILPIFDSGYAGELHYYVTPYVEGESLEQRIEHERQLPVDAALDIACEVADALAHAHAHGLVHRDIKPANILLAHGHAMIVDFGIARLAERNADKLTDSGMALGTATYMSPEQAAGGSVDGRSDIYSLGCVLYEMLAGHPPFGGANAQAVIARHMVDPVPQLRGVRPTVSPAVDATIRKAMAKSPADRFANAGEFRDAIRQAQTGITPSRFLKSGAGRSRRLLKAATAIAVPAALIIAAGMIFGSRIAQLRGHACVGRNERIFSEQRLYGRHYRQQQLLLRASPMCLRFDDDLMLAIDGRHAGVALDDTFPGCHLCTLIIGVIALPYLTLSTAAVVGMRSEPLAKLRGIMFKPCNAFRILRGKIRLSGGCVSRTMPFHHRGGRRFELRGLACEIRTRPTAMLRRVARQLHAINSKHLAANQSLAITDREHGGEYMGDLLTEGTDEVGDRREMWRCIATKGDERDVLLAHPFDSTTADDALRIREEDYLQQHCGRIRRGSGYVVPKAGIEMGEIDRVVEQVIQRMLERTGQQLPRQIDG